MGKKGGDIKRERRKREERPRGAAATCRMQRYAVIGRQEAVERTNSCLDTDHTEYFSRC